MSKFQEKNLLTVLGLIVTKQNDLAFYVFFFFIFQVFKKGTIKSKSISKLQAKYFNVEYEKIFHQKMHAAERAKFSLPYKRSHVENKATRLSPKISHMPSTKQSLLYTFFT